MRIMGLNRQKGNVTRIIIPLFIILVAAFALSTVFVQRAAAANPNCVDGDGALTVIPSPVTVGQAGNNFSFVFTNPTGCAWDGSKSFIQVTVPAGWQAPSLSPGAGYVAITNNTCGTSPTISLPSASVIKVLQLGCTATQSFTITYSNVTAPSTPQTATFTAQTTNHGASTLANINPLPSVTVNKGNTTASITANTPNPSLVGQAVTVNYSVSANTPASGTPTGNVAVTDGVDSCTGTVAAGSCIITLNDSGSRTLTATYAGDTNFNASPASPGVTQTVNKADQATLNIVAPASLAYGSAAILSTTGGSGTGAVTYSAGVSTGCSVGGSTLSVTNVSGTCSVTAAKAADANYNAATSLAATVPLIKANASVTTWPTAAAITYGQTLASSTLSGGVATPAGSFAFTTPSTAPNAGTASQGVTYTPTDTVNYNIATGSVSVTANKATATVTLGSLNHSYDGTPKSATAATSPEGLTVSFTYDGSSSAPSSIGSYTVVGTINDSNYQGSATGTMEITSGAVHHFLVEAVGGGDIVPQTAGTSFNIRITAQDSFNNTVTGFTGTVQITSSGELIGSPVTSGAFVAGVLESQSVTIASAGTGLTLTANNGVNGTSNGFTVNAAGINNFLIEAADGGNVGTQTAGAPFDIRITARDQFHNTVTNFSGVVELTTNAGTITPDSVTFTGTEGGVLTVNGVTVTLAGTSKNITAASGSDSSTSNGFTVNPGGVGNFLIGAPLGGGIGPQTVGAPFDIQITARDQFNNTVTSFSGSVDLTTNAGTITPGSVTFTGSESGVLAVNSITVMLAGTDKYITATFGSDAGTSNAFTVNGANTSVSVSPSINPSTYGQAVDLTGTVESSGGTPTGNVDFRDGGGDCSAGTLLGTSALGSGSATLNISTLSVGSHTVRACYLGDSNFNAGDGTVILTVDKATATVMLGDLSQAYDGTPKSATAATSPEGLTVSFTYDGSATVPTNAGSYAVAGTINDINYQGSATGTMVIGKATPTITWGTPADITYGTALSGTQLNATASVSGAFIYTPSAGTVLGAGSGQGLNVNFTPADSVNYNSASSSVTINITKATATVTLGSLSQAYDGTPKSATAATSPAGLTVSFTYDGLSSAPSNFGSYTVVGTINEANYQGSATGTIVIGKATPTITWGTPADIAYGTALSGTQLNATASVPGTFIYTPSAGTVLGAGSGQGLNVNFTPADSVNYNSASSSVTITVTDTAPEFNTTSPVSDSYRNTAVVGYILNKDVASGTVTFTRTGGSADVSSPHVYNFTAPDMTAGSHTITTGLSLVDGAIYTVSFDAMDGAGYAAVTVSNTNILHDASAAAVTLNSPASISSVNNTEVRYTLSKDVASGRIVYTRTSGTADGASPHTYTLGGPELAAGPHTVTTGLPLVDGAVYTVDIDNVVDLEENTSSVVSNTDIIYDTTVVVITNTSPAASSVMATAAVSYTLSEQASAGKVTFTNTGGTPDASSPQVYMMTDSDLTAGAHTVVTGLGLIDGGIYTVSFDATDMAGNPATTVSNASVTFDTTAPAGITFTAQTGVAVNALITSDVITVSGVSADAPISVTGGWYAVNGSAFTSAPGTVNNGDTVQVEQISSSFYSTTTDTILTIGDVGGTFSVSTAAANTPPVASRTISQSGWAVSIADGSTDGEDVQNLLAVTVDCGNGTKQFGHGGDTLTCMYTTAGSYVIKHSVKDTGGLTSWSVNASVSVPVKYTLSGRVVRSNGTTAIGGVTLYLNNGTKNTNATSTKTDGTYTFTNVAPGSYNLTAAKAGYTFNNPAVTGIVVTSGDVTGVNFSSITP